ncbi:hypothetical protein DICSQDRAFT_174203 [Dichomitus squalens LYAD-421 SS1]|uniref:Uncharacterized protein n=1 Tax=Dichomitus squalens (strain LYAD-421) TaxID=732165 RepID=R7SQA1_DICSQ|nr:uncharacterized protein DICSQDRAFT_174203 [Dichomitus squalens LYAD-421 SS1]EJF57142.1 hypothetical protein DICSQDRAFT_174203 [Dichomitus squalens LYAD-421 SS1]
MNVLSTLSSLTGFLNWLISEVDMPLTALLFSRAYLERADTGEEDDEDHPIAPPSSTVETLNFTITPLAPETVNTNEAREVESLEWEIYGNMDRNGNMDRDGETISQLSYPEQESSTIFWGDTPVSQ